MPLVEFNVTWRNAHDYSKPEGSGYKAEIIPKGIHEMVESAHPRYPEVPCWFRKGTMIGVTVETLRACAKEKVNPLVTIRENSP